MSQTCYEQDIFDRCAVVDNEACILLRVKRLKKKKFVCTYLMLVSSCSYK